MKVAAHPLVVAVALGLVGAQILDSADELEVPEGESGPCADCDEPAAMADEGLSNAVATQLVDASNTTLHPTTDWSSAAAPSAEDFARVALAFEKARNLV